MAQPPVSSLTGGCLCGGVRYNVNIKAEDSWPPDCRKWGGTILMHFIAFKPSQIAWEGSPVEFESSPGRFRRFCPTCGTNLTWREVVEGLDEVELCVGTLDEEFLKDGKLARDLLDPIGGRFWAQNEISGMDYGFTGGKRHMEGSKSEVIE
ncbi:hypothetical protein FQN54_000238 [Arachnomyces sp. PD_36]|nr:hypothetical protein FQN54_000238 [Arachnomyces sp. PD_36]